MLGFGLMFVAVCIICYFLNKAMWKAEEDNARIERELREPRCPKCGSFYVEYDDCIDTEFDRDYIAQFIVGHCIECETELQWVENYRFVGVGEMGEVK